ncbi:MAG: hypothetical protein V7711_02850 [Pseudomonadales bacterium]
MNWDVIGSVAELFGAAGVIVSLLYLSYQIRINTKTVKAEATQTTYTGWSEFNYELSKHPNAVEIDRMWKPDSLWDDFSEEEKVKLGWVCRSIVMRFEAEFSLYEAGILKPEVWEKHRTYCGSFVNLPAVSTWWESEKEQPICSESFITEIEGAPQHAALTAGSINE